MPSATDIFIISGIYALMSAVWVVYRSTIGKAAQNTGVYDRLALYGAIQWTLMQVIVIGYLIFK